MDAGGAAVPLIELRGVTQRFGQRPPPGPLRRTLERLKLAHAPAVTHAVDGVDLSVLPGEVATPILDKRPVPPSQVAVARPSNGLQLEHEKTGPGPVFSLVRGMLSRDGPHDTR